MSWVNSNEVDLSDCRFVALGFRARDGIKFILLLHSIIHPVICTRITTTLYIMPPISHLRYIRVDRDIAHPISRRIGTH